MTDNFELWARGRFHSRKWFHKWQGNIGEPGKKYVTLSNTTNFTVLNTISFWVNCQFCTSSNVGPCVEIGNRELILPHCSYSFIFWTSYLFWRSTIVVSCSYPSLHIFGNNILTGEVKKSDDFFGSSRTRKENKHITFEKPKKYLFADNYISAPSLLANGVHILFLFVKLNISSRECWPFVCLLLINEYSGPLSILKLDYLGFLLLSCMGSLCILDINPFTRYMVYEYFLLFHWLPFHFVDCFLCCIVWYSPTNFTNNQGNTSQNHTEISPHPSYNGCYQKDKR